MQFDFPRQCVPGKELLIADTLSRIRVPSRDATARELKDWSIYAACLLPSLASDVMRKELAAAKFENEYLREMLRTLESDDTIEGMLALFAPEFTEVLVILL